MKVVRYFHIRHLNSAKGGATVRVEGDNEGTLEDEVHVTVAKCSQKDAFCRKAGRTVADEKLMAQNLPLKGLPGKLHRVALSVLKRTKNTGQRVETELYKRDFGFSTKYFRAPEIKEEKRGIQLAE